MENLFKHQEKQNPSFLSSPKSYSSNSSTSSASNGLHPPPSPHHCHFPPPTPPTPPPQSPIPITRSDPNNPNPTTFVQADTSSFKQVVQMLTGSSETAKIAASPASACKPEPLRNPIPPIRTIPKIQKSNSKLYERRNSFRNFKISPLGSGQIQSKPGFSSCSPRPGTPEILSPSILDFPSLALSPVTPLIPDPFNRTGQFLNSKSNLVDLEAEEKAIAQKGFFLHPSPATTPTDSKPRLLPLFPETSPRVAGSSDSAS